ncbi:cell division protein FtsQ [Virgibacillus halotolerans]|uniref:cell division protein FtsQ/DivIB n=1 Tax=Virgibacillus halotolerans TaxID=1071053 RepID=UPI00196152F2|nr:cell division protein FtsQ/DivIB [Virgibacillus halotolerans]MBM7598682.1 cell division protein FtsQ [Virgibacillus halotolerans]
MSKKKIVSIEDRIPKLKQARKKKANRRLVFYLTIFFFLISIIVYLQSPLSHIKTISVTGNSYIAEESIINESGLTTDMNIWTINKSDIKKSLNENPVVESVEIGRKLPSTVEIQISEHELVGYVEKDNNYYPILGNGKTLEAFGKSSFNGNAPLLLDFKDKEYLHSMTGELKKLPDSITNLISEIHWKPTDDNKHKILLYMNDGFVVSGTIRDFAEKMKVYPSIVSQLDTDSKGIIHIGVGVYFESFDKDSEDNNEDESIDESVDQSFEEAEEAEMESNDGTE